MRENDTLVAGSWVVGRVVAGRYRLRSAVGVGAMGVVWEADDLRLDRAVALKQLRLPPGLGARAMARARHQVFREARIAARLQHPHAVTVYDVTTDDHGHPMLVLEYLPSQSLAAALTGQGPLRPVQVARIGSAVASALSAAHAAGIVHRDVKPANILLSGDGAAKITDFGLSHLTGEAIRQGRVAGTPVFLSPEAARGEGPSPESDVFSLGATLYLAVEGAPPFGAAEDPRVQVERVAGGQAPPPRQAGPLTSVLTRMLRDDPAERPAMSEVADALTDIAVGGAEPAAVTLPDLPAPGGRGRRLVYLAVGLIAVGLLALVPLTSLDGGGHTPAAPQATGSIPTSSAPTGSTTTTESAVVSPSPGPPPPAATGGPPAADPALMQQVVTQFYSLLPGDTAGAWALLGPAMQAQGQAGFEQFWAGVKDLQIRAAPRVVGNTVVVDIEYVQASRGRVRETHQHEILLRDGVALINSDQVVSTEANGKQPQPPPKKNGK